MRSALVTLLLLLIVREAIETNESFPDPDDTVFFEVAMAVRQEEEASFLLTGNIKHFPISPIVATPAQFVAIMEAYQAGG